MKEVCIKEKLYKYAARIKLSDNIKGRKGRKLYDFKEVKEREN